MKKKVPVVIFRGTPNWNVLHKTVDQFEQDCQATLQMLSQSLQLARQWEGQQQNQNENLFSERIQQRIDKLSVLYSHNAMVLRTLLTPFSVVRVIKSKMDHFTNENIQENLNNGGLKEDNNEIRYFDENVPDQWNHTTAPPKAFSSQAYDSGAQILAHLVRDWSLEEGQDARKSLYSWCTKKVQEFASEITQNSHQGNIDQGNSQRLRILVPGAGLGRLAWDLAETHSVEAIEYSVCMVAVVQALLCRPSKTIRIYPYVVDRFANEVHSDLRYQPVDIPSIEEDEVPTNRSLSYTVADFTEYKSQEESRDAFQVVVTCFFIDTATNIYEYLATIRHVLGSGGIWINVGPLHWHANAQLHPSVDDLRAIIEGIAGFEILEWSVDEKALEYRGTQDGDMFPSPVSTHQEGYRPLRSVVKMSG